jgi:hypothetical protein
MHAIPTSLNTKLARSWETTLSDALNAVVLNAVVLNEQGVVRVDGLLVVLGVKSFQDADRARYRLLEALLVPAVPLN